MESFDARETLQKLNARVQIDGESDQAVAADYLKTQGLSEIGDIRLPSTAGSARGSPGVPLSAAPGGVRLDRLGALLSLAAAAALVLLPFVVFKANRIVPGDPRGLFQALPDSLAGACALALAATAAVAVSGARARVRLAAALIGRRRARACRGRGRQTRSRRRATRWCASPPVRPSGCCWCVSGSWPRMRSRGCGRARAGGCCSWWLFLAVAVLALASRHRSITSRSCASTR